MPELANLEVIREVLDPQLTGHEVTEAVMVRPRVVRDLIGQGERWWPASGTHKATRSVSMPASTPSKSARLYRRGRPTACTKRYRTCCVKRSSRCEREWAPISTTRCGTSCPSTARTASPAPSAALASRRSGREAGSPTSVGHASQAGCSGPRFGVQRKSGVWTTTLNHATMSRVEIHPLTTQDLHPRLRCDGL
jgi:hypothetical protein